MLQYNFVGRLLGPRGNSLKRVEATTECRVLIRGRGSIKDPARVIYFSFIVAHRHISELDLTLMFAHEFQKALMMEFLLLFFLTIYFSVQF